MYDISSNRPLPEGHSTRNGLSKTIREMCKNDSFELPASKKPSAYSAAKLVGAKITVRDTGEGTAIVWRLDGAERIGIFGQPAQPPKPEIFK